MAIGKNFISPLRATIEDDSQLELCEKAVKVIEVPVWLRVFYPTMKEFYDLQRKQVKPNSKYVPLPELLTQKDVMAAMVEVFSAIGVVSINPKHISINFQGFIKKNLPAGLKHQAAAEFNLSSLPRRLNFKVADECQPAEADYE